jgi:tetratricopeptide (TPR) repeat protein
MEKKRELLFMMVLITVLIFIYQHTLKYDLIWDTQTFIDESFLLNSNMSPLAAFKYGYIYGQLGMQEQSFYYRPLVNLSFMLEKKLWGLKNTTLRLTNLFIFIITVIFLFWFFRLQSNNERFPYVAIVLFSLSPLNMENIVWVVGRCDLLVMLWGVLTLLFLQLYIEKRRLIFMSGSLIFFALGLFSKETFIFFWPLLVIFQLQRQKRLSWFYHLSTAIITLVFFWIKNILLGIGNMHFVVADHLWGYLQTGLSVLGYYFRILIFPFFFDNFSFVNKIASPFYIILGVMFIILFLLAIYVSKKAKRDLFPVFLTAVFLIPYVILAFSTLWPFRISSRYMMVAFLGIAWLAAICICRLRVKLQNVIVISLIILFGSSLISGIHRYRSERAFWEDALESHPENSFVLLKMANVCYTENDDFTSLHYYNQALKNPMGKTTAIEISIGIARLAYERGDYRKALDWLNRLQFELQPYQRFQVVKLKASIYISQAKVDQAEKLLRENMDRFGKQREIHLVLYRMYVGYGNWARARDLERQIIKRFPPPYEVSTSRTRKVFDQMNAAQKRDFYVRHKNYSAAIELLGQPERLGMDAQLLRNELHYRMGNAAYPQKWVENIFRRYPGDFQIRNRIGYFYLRRMKRLNDALICFRESLRINPDQSGIKKLYDYLLQQREKLGGYVL